MPKINPKTSKGSTSQQQENNPIWKNSTEFHQTKLRRFVKKKRTFLKADCKK
jgi:hypothetical protein